MNRNKYSFYFVVAFILSAAACELTDVSKLDPVNQLSEEQAITTVSQAQSILYGTYGLVRSGLEMIVYYPGNCALMGGTMDVGSFGGVSEASYKNNDVPADNYYLDAIYTRNYKIINNANHIIEKAPLIETGDLRRDEIVGEAKFLRALSHFYLLRMFGQFYDQNSLHGIVIKDKPIKLVAPEGKSGVKAVYDFILADLDDAIAKAPKFSRSVYASREAALALKAKVLLYAGLYGEAATTAQEVIESGAFKLEDKFSDIFTKKIVNTTEAIFQTPYDDKNDRNNKAFMFRSTYVPSAYYANILLGDNRDTAALIRNSNGTLRNKKFNNTVFNGQTLTADTEYFLRLAEIYLIQAEAIVRSGGSFSDACDAVNEVRLRAVMPGISSTDKTELLELIRKEKILELGAESGEEWFDLVRYAVKGDIDIKAIKPGVISSDKYILPLPYTTVQLSGGVLIQNPEY